MDESGESKHNVSLSDYLAAERTLLAWIRTGLALMGFGFVVARFGLFLQQIQIAQNASLGKSTGLSLWFGVVLIASGVVVSVAAGLNHVRLVRELDRGGPLRPHAATLAVVVAMFLALVGIGMAIYLFKVRGSDSQHSTNKTEDTMSLDNRTGIVEIPSHHSVEETLEKTKTLLSAKGISLFAVVDHSGEAAKVGMTMRPTKLVIFGSPKAGTPVMLAAPSSAIDLPLKILIRENAEGKVLVSYNSTEYLAQRHGIPAELAQNLAAVKTLAEKAAE